MIPQYLHQMDTCDLCWCCAAYNSQEFAEWDIFDVVLKNYKNLPKYCTDTVDSHLIS